MSARVIGPGEGRNWWSGTPLSVTRKHDDDGICDDAYSLPMVQLAGWGWGRRPRWVLAVGRFGSRMERRFGERMILIPPLRMPSAHSS
jgi:hypothetical protein